MSSLLPRHDSLAYQSNDFSEEERVEMVLDDLLAHVINRNQAVERIYEVLRAVYAGVHNRILDHRMYPKEV